jgi:hypothetical protein
MLRAGATGETGGVVIGPEAGEMAIIVVADVTWVGLLLSVTETVKVAVPVVVGVPEIVPVPRLSPAGNLPEAIDHV